MLLVAFLNMAQECYHRINGNMGWDNKVSV